jgi:catechol 2,3-dioxygenase-like lactoylglutathione lyase family enzyme
MATATLPVSAETTDVFPINGTDFIEFWVGNAKQAAHFYRSAFGFRLRAGDENAADLELGGFELSFRRAADATREGIQIGFRVAL